MLKKKELSQTSYGDIYNINGSNVEINYYDKKHTNNIADDELMELANSLLASSQPDSLLTLFPGLHKNVKQAILNLEIESRHVIERQDKELYILDLAELLNAKGNLHLINAPGGAGKTHSLWNLGKKLLKESEFIPIYIPIKDFSSTKDVIKFLLLKISTDDINVLAKNPRVIFLLDGWSEFPNNTVTFNYSEKRKLLNILGERKIIATARYSTHHDRGFRIWDLEGLSDFCIKQAISTAFQNTNPIPLDLYDFLKLPLFLILYLLLGGNATNQGTLIRKFHEHLIMDLDSRDSLTNIMGIVAANIELLRDGKKFRQDFEIEVDYVAERINFLGAKETINKLGILGVRQDVVQPIHDLYWEWLVGCGIFNNWNDISFEAVRNLTTRKAFKLCAESGKQLTIEQLQSLSYDDIVLAAELLSNFRIRSKQEKQAKDEIYNRINDMLSHEDICTYYRGLMAAFSSKDRDLFFKALNVLSDLSRDGYYFEGLDKFIEPKVLWEYRDEMGLWLRNAYGDYYIFNAIKNSRDIRWSDWIEEQFLKGNVSLKEAISVSLACTFDLPKWVEDNLPKLLIEDNGAYCLREAAKRGDNIALAEWVAQNYEKYSNIKNSTAFYFNEVLIECGNDDIYDYVIEKYETFEPRVQELLSYAIVKMGPKRLGKLQRKLLDDELRDEHHELYNNIVYEEIPDDKARKWTLSENQKICLLGWQVLAKRYQSDILDELILGLPSSFSGLHFVPTLKAMKCIDSLPESLIDQLWKRFEGTIQPMLLNDLLCVFFKVKPTGIPSVVAALRNNPQLFPVFHITRFISLLKEWEEETGLKIMVENNNGRNTFSEYLVLNNINRENEDTYFIADMCKSIESDLVLDYLAYLWESGNNHIYEIIKNMNRISKYNNSLVNLILSQPEGVKDCIELYGSNLNMFPEDILIKILEDIINHDTNRELFDKLIYYISEIPSDKHTEFHSKILQETIDYPCNEVNLYRKTAMILSVHSDEQLRNMLHLHLKDRNSNVIWLIRHIEMYRNRLLIDEKGRWLL